MEYIETKAELKAVLNDWRLQGDHIALVPTMGNLHAGHLSLCRQASEVADRVVATIFVNPTQFGAGEDFEEYPRTLERDSRRLKKVRADVLFAPDVDAIYPFGLDNATRVSVPVLTENLCGAFRPGPFDGVTGVVARLFAIVHPDVAGSGQKDFPHQLVIRRMVDDLSLPIAIITAPTVREDDGLAMSSRNSYLTEAERLVAPELYRVLRSIGADLQNGKRDFAELENWADATLRQAGLEPEYVAVRRALDLSEPDRDCDELVVLAAARLGKTRLIDNVVVTV